MLQGKTRKEEEKSQTSRRIPCFGDGFSRPEISSITHAAAEAAPAKAVLPATD
jgi:hypothetical protein